jgi:tRNA 2-thiouridine synthesizing protein A
MEKEHIEAQVETDFGDMGCGDLVMALLKIMRRMEVGQVIKFRALDPGAPADIPAWCRMRGYALLAGPGGEDGTWYYVQKSH